ncbi:MAG: deoxyhypusine synthase [Candidatus Aenigmarchaeota archaeon]|nr:deoxyhypusine synthase [Candidatus Aenigmarchaeota archaeon]
MDKEELLQQEVEDFRVGKETVAELVDKMHSAGGFSSKNLATAVNILKSMNSDNCKKVLSFTADLIATGLRGVIAQMIEQGMVDVIITTCGTLDHDLARAWGGKYYHGSFELDDHELQKLGINRLGNVLVPNESYGTILEEKMQPILSELSKQKAEWGPRELIHEFGLRVNDKNSILYQAAKKNIPVYVPGITDGAFGANLVWFSQENKFKVDVLKDERELADIFFSKSKFGALMLGGGISKHHTIWWSQFANGLQYAVQITTATQYDGSLSGARLKEAVSWGKVAQTAKYVNVDGDVTILLPLIISAILEK